MLGRIKKELKDLGDGRAHMHYNPQGLVTDRDYFDELKKLSGRTNARFRIVGDHKHFTVRMASDAIFVSCLLALLVAIPTVLLFKHGSDIVFWLVEVAVIVACFLLLRYYPSTHHVEIDSNHQTIKITSTNWLKNRMSPLSVFAFKDFEKFTHQEKSAKGDGVSSHFNMIYMHGDGRKIFLIDLLNGPFYYVNHHVFIRCLTAIIRNSR